MNPNYSSPRNFNATQVNGHPPFYNPQPKDMPSHFANPVLPRSPNSLQFMNPQMQHPSSKSYTLKPNFQPLKSNSNNSAYMKSSIQTNSTQSNFSNFSPSYPKVAGEMSKSSFHDPPRLPQHPINFSKTTQRVPISTPNRRQPRYSEPANMEPPSFQITQDTKSSFIPYGSNKGLQTSKQQQDVHFFKKNIQSPQTSKEEQKKKNWIKKSPVNSKQGVTFSLDNFQLVRNLGSGKYGKVFLAKQKMSGFICALKMIDKAVLIEEQIVQQFIREVKIQMFLNHPNIIKMYGCFEDQEHIYIILEIAMGGQLFQQFKRTQPLPEVKAAAFMKQICTSIDQLHSHRIIHRDLKPQNIVLHEGVIKLCDFGWSVHLDNKMRTTFCGTPLYVCPQILRGKQYDQKIDIWSVGIMMYEMLVGESPFKINKEEELIKIVKDQISIPSYVYVSKEGRDFLDKCLQKNPNDRVTIKELANHPFLIKNAEKEKTEKKENF